MFSITWRCNAMNVPFVYGKYITDNRHVTDVTTVMFPLSMAWLNQTYWTKDGNCTMSAGTEEVGKLWPARGIRINNCAAIIGRDIAPFSWTDRLTWRSAEARIAAATGRTRKRRCDLPSLTVGSLTPTRCGAHGIAGKRTLRHDTVPSPISVMSINLLAICVQL